MSIAINTRRTSATTGPRQPRAVAIERVAPSIKEQLQDVRALLRHFMLAFAGAAAAIYALLASGITI